MSFINNIQALYGNSGKQWLLKLPNIVAEFAKTWGLSNLQPVANLSYNYVLSGLQNQIPIILKLSFEHADLTREMYALKAFSGYGGVKVLEYAQNALLLQRAVPGKSLKNLSQVNPKLALQICCECMAKLHQAPLPQEKIFPQIHDWLVILDKPWDIPKQYLLKARQLKNSLFKTNLDQVLLHGDLHHDNILSNGNDWLIIDPKGVYGHPIHEVWAFIINVEDDTKYVANFFNYDLQQLRQWYFVHTILASCWNLEDNLSPELFLNLAAKTYPLL
jgi:streptomycin 6-kinase